MNFLGHAVFSPADPALLTGNMISDFVKGKSRFDYPLAVQQGIALHRGIDAFTDAHPATRAAREPFRPAYRLYAAAMVDVSFDYFIANDPALFPNEDRLMAFSQETYAALADYAYLMPPRFGAMFGYMRQQNWLYHYRFPQGMRQSFGGLVRRAAYLQDADEAFDLFTREQRLLAECYAAFMPDFRRWYQSFVEALPEAGSDDTSSV